MNRKTTLRDHSDLPRKLLHNVEAFIDEVGARGCTSHLETATTNGKYLKGSRLGQQPERFVEDHLVFPVLETLEHTFRPRPIQYAPRWNAGRGVPDFSLTTVPTSTAKEQDIRLFGEVKPPNKLTYAQEDVREYLQKDLDFHALAVLTDGVEWELWLRPQNQPLDDDYEPQAKVSLRRVIGEVKSRNIEQESYHPYDARGEIDEDDFSEFKASSVLNTIRSEFGIEVGRD